MKKAFIRFICLFVFLMLSLLQLNAQTTYVFSSNTRSALPITVTVNGNIYRLVKATEFPKAGNGDCITLTISGSMVWSATDCDGDRMTKYERGVLTESSPKTVSIRLFGTTKVHKNRSLSTSNNTASSSTSNRNIGNSSSNGNYSFKESAANALANFAGSVLTNLVNRPTLSQFLVQNANNGKPSAVDMYGSISFWGGKNYFLKDYNDIPLNHIVTLNCLIYNNHQLWHSNSSYSYENDAEIGFMYGRGMGTTTNLETANFYFDQAYDRINDNTSITNLAQADILIRTAKKDTLQALDLISQVIGTSSENILNGILPEVMQFCKKCDSVKIFDCNYSGGAGGVSACIRTSAFIDLGNILWAGCQSFEPNKELALEVFRKIRENNNKTEGYVHLEVGNALMDIYNAGERSKTVHELMTDCYTIASQSQFKEYGYSASYSLGTIYMYTPSLRDFKKAEFYLKKAKKTADYKLKGQVNEAFQALKRLKKESKK